MPVLWDPDPSIPARRCPQRIVRSLGAVNRRHAWWTVPPDPPGSLRSHGAGVRVADQHSIGGVDALCHATGEALVAVTAALVSTLPSAPMAHAGTRWPLGGHTWWLWMVRRARATVFVPSYSPGGRVIRELTWADSHGVVSSDRDAGTYWPDPA